MIEFWHVSIDSPVLLLGSSVLLRLLLSIVSLRLLGLSHLLIRRASTEWKSLALLVLLLGSLLGSLQVGRTLGCNWALLLVCRSLLDRSLLLAAVVRLLPRLLVRWTLLLLRLVALSRRSLGPVSLLLIATVGGRSLRIVSGSLRGLRSLLLIATIPLLNLTVVGRGAVRSLLLLLLSIGLLRHTVLPRTSWCWGALVGNYWTMTTLRLWDLVRFRDGIDA